MLHGSGSSVSSPSERIDSSRSANLLLRVVTAAVGIPLVVLVTQLGGLVFALTLGLVACVATAELTIMVRRSGRHPVMAVAVLASVACAVIPVLAGSHAQAVWTGVVGATMFLAGVWSFGRPIRAEALGDWAVTIASPLYVGILLGHLGLLRNLPDGARWVLLALIVTWAYDSGAYLTGWLAGRTPFMQHISPRKTLEGVAGGLVFAMVAALLATLWVGLAPWQALSLGLLIGVVGQTGDLVESWLKRVTGVKDSGTIVPGHGGLLDRIDSLLFTGALTYYVAALFGHVP